MEDTASTTVKSSDRIALYSAYDSSVEELTFSATRPIWSAYADRRKSSITTALKGVTSPVARYISRKRKKPSSAVAYPSGLKPT